MPYEKHADARDAYTMDFSAQMTGAESISGTPTVKVWRGTTDVTSQFITTAATVNGAVVSFTMDAAAAGAQAGATYTVYVLATTATGRRLVATDSLTVTTKGRP